MQLLPLTVDRQRLNQCSHYHQLTGQNNTLSSVLSSILSVDPTINQPEQHPELRVELSAGGRPCNRRARPAQNKARLATTGQLIGLRVKSHVRWTVRSTD